MLSNKQERTFSNAPLRDQWEKRAQNIAAQCKQEAEWKEKSVKLLFSKWTYHLIISHGDKLSDLKKLTNSTNEEETKPKIKFKIVPPPPRIKHEPALPPPSPRRKASSGPRRPKRKVNVDMFKLHWRESWMSLKPPKYLYLKTKEMKTRIPGFTTIKLTNNRRYKRTWSGSLAELMCLHEKWTHSWKQVKSPAQLERSEEKQFQWEILFESHLPCKPEIEEYFLPVWARTWKFMNFAFRQQKQNWDCIWLDYQQILSNKFDKVQQLEEQPGWTNSWLLTVAPLQEDEEYQKNWSSCWGFRQQIRWCKASQQSQYQHSNMLMRRRKIMNLLLTSRLENKITNSTEWSEAWRMPKQSGRLEEDEPEDEEEMDIEETMDTEGEEEDERVDHEEDVNVDDEEERDEGVDEEEEDVGKEDEEDIGKNEQYEQIHKECPKEIYKKEDKEIYKKNEQVEDNNGEKDEGVDEEEEEDKKVNKENKKEVEEEDKISNEKDKESEVDEEKEEEDADKEGEVSDSDEEEEIDEETDKERKEEPKVDKPVKNEVNEKDEDNDNVEEEGTEIEEDGGEKEKEDDVEKEQDREEETEVEEEDEEVNEKAKVHKKDDKTKEEEEEETDEKEETDEEDEVTAISEENGSHEEMDKKEEDNVVEKEKEKKKLRKGVKRKPDVPLHLQFHKLNMSFSSWNQSWMVVVAHRGGDGNEEEEDEAEEKEEWWPWKESWRICRWRKLDEDEEVCFSMEHRTQRHLGLMHEEDGMPRSKWTLSWKMTNAAAEEEDTEEEDEEEEEEET
ncbi:myb-like protein X isoform X2 [Mastacembelus armatus]|uniref:myb-like protein X isoform X2 n=1 Tax=Mastacembelus armatus TaxID=205130 RepID=UPI000E45D1DE|nr:myb-like protein X isoform X2 [Mastacembelus armatus]XP_026152463.1 myb-like protein X isoform X2 [Mastacembelus armatus]